MKGVYIYEASGGGKKHTTQGKEKECMNSLNSILVEGNLTRDPVLNETPKGTSVCTFGLASNRFYKQGDENVQEVSFFDVETWARLADNCAEHLNKGRGVRVVGRLKQDRWKDQEGKNHSRVKIVAEHVEFRPQFKGNGKDGEAEKAKDREEKDIDVQAADVERELEGLEPEKEEVMAS